MIDTHAHLANRLKQETDLTSLDWVVLSASCLQDSKDNLELAKTNKKLLPAVGIHPQEQISDLRCQMSDLETLLRNNKNIVAVGECGLENPSKSPFDLPAAMPAGRQGRAGKGDFKKQAELFEEQIKLSLKYQKPLIVHSRKAADETVEILKSFKGLRGVIHCYTGGKKRIKNYLTISDEWYFGIDGNITYESGLVEVVKNIPKDRLLAETDTPFLAPIPHRGETNRPEYVKYVYQKIGEVWGVSFEETEKVLDDNAKRLFGV